MSQLNVLIVGASIAGPMTAYWFAKAGARVTVIERFSELRTGGQNIDIRTAGVTVMRKIPGMEAEVRAKTTTIEGISIVRDDGRPYGILRASGNPDQQSLISEYEIFRGDLSKILYDLTKDNENVNYIFGEQVASIQQDEKYPDAPIKVEFLNSSLPTTEYDLVVACDGATSRTRAIGLNCGVRDHIESINAWAAFCSTEVDILEGSKIETGYSVVGGRFTSVGPDPSGLNRISLWGIHPRNDRDATLPFREAMKQSNDALKRFIATHHRSTGWKSEQILDCMVKSTDFYASEVVQVKVPSLFKGRFVLVGDAGYAPGPTGGGTTLAMAGAYLLAGEISKHQGNLKAGLAGYEAQMRPLITEMQKIPPLVPTVMAPQTAWGIWLRNAVFALITWTRVLDFAQRYWAGAFTNSEEYRLPEYEWVA